MNRLLPSAAVTSVAAAVLLAVGCSRAREPVRIGVVLPPDFAAPAAFAAEEINAAGGVRGHPLELVRDSAPPGPPSISGSPIVLAASVLRLPVVAVVGHEGSGQSLAAAPVYNAARVVQLVPTGTSRLLARAGEWTLALAPDDSVEGRFIAGFVRDRLRARSVTIFYNNTEYGIGLRDGVEGALAGSGVGVLRVVRYDGSADLAVLVEAALRHGTPDAVVIAGYARDAGRIAGQLRDRGVRSPIVAGDGAHVLPDLVTPRPDAATGMYVVTFWLPGSADSATRRFETVVRQRLGREPAARDAMVYDAVRLLATAVEAVGDRPRRVRDYLLALGVGRPRYRGITGEIGFGAGAGAPRFVMGQVRGTVVVPVEALAR
ncbi:MAG: ABC transporter substrate-binding protein [Gemmatimonadales bacterium]|jgi:branched-chain amino acid transport system substrate-binding protein